jgi:hypothetical protein
MQEFSKENGSFEYLFTVCESVLLPNDFLEL